MYEWCWQSWSKRLNILFSEKVLKIVAKVILGGFRDLFHQSYYSPAICQKFNWPTKRHRGAQSCLRGWASISRCSFDEMWWKLSKLETGLHVKQTVFKKGCMVCSQRAMSSKVIKHILLWYLPQRAKDALWRLLSKIPYQSKNSKLNV